METVLLICGGVLFWNFTLYNFYEAMSDIHAATTVALALLTITTPFPDQYIFALSTSYFMVDLVEVVVHWNTIYVIHHVLAILVPVCGVLDPAITIGSDAGAYIILIELSTLFLNNWTRNRSSKKAYFSLLGVYFLNRIMYLSYLLYFSFISKPSNIFGKLTLYSLRLLHVLMCLWFYKLCLKYKRLNKRK